ncbi:exonuclease domain-containing protein [Streptomyces sp. NPDC003273]|uniref:exonuclease domain-containing protein n=1 Tax=Streptomyces sp. NPDC003273 TaxID=3364678 RepID=UPI0036928F6B
MASRPHPSGPTRSQSRSSCELHAHATLALCSDRLDVAAATPGDQGSQLRSILTGSTHVRGGHAVSDTWVAIDFETANGYRGSPCAVGLAAVEDGRITDRMYTLIRPPAAYGHFASYNTRVHGIRATDVDGAPSWLEALQQIMKFTAGRIIVAHNAAFDLGVLRDACTAEGSAWPTLRYTCSLVAARRTWRLLSYGLPEIAKHVGAPLADHHHAGADAEAAAHIMLAAMQYHQAMTLTHLLEKLSIVNGTITSETWSGSRCRTTKRSALLPGANPDADPDGALYGKTVCITGKLSSMTRDEAHNLIAHVGGKPVSNVGTKTNVLVHATLDPRYFTMGSEKSNKLKAAERLLDAGQEIEVIGEADFFERLNS